jgi:23S rRNA U2552 (ribose-2'-O)-methylase RlmE/FtsJ
MYSKFMFFVAVLPICCFVDAVQFFVFRDIVIEDLVKEMKDAEVAVSDAIANAENVQERDSSRQLECIIK